MSRPGNSKNTPKGVDLGIFLGFADELSKIAMAAPKPAGLTEIKKVISPKKDLTKAYAKVGKDEIETGGLLNTPNSMPPPPVTAG